MADLPGQAISDFYFNKSRTKLYVHDRFGPKVEMPVSLYFRNSEEMPELERKAISLCTGKILDAGAGAGSHALELQLKKAEVTALEISPLACEVMNARGVKNVVCEDIFKYTGAFDSLLLLMNGIGLCGDLEGFKRFLRHSEKLLAPSGKIIFDSCDIEYMYEDIPKPQHYYGEVQCRYSYGRQITDWFSWLYLDQKTLAEATDQLGWDCDIILEDDNSQFLAVLSKR